MHNTGGINGILTCGHQATAGEGIAGVIARASANRCMIDHIAERIRSTRSWTRVPTLFPDASLITGAVRVNGTLRSTIRGRTNVIAQTGAGWNASYVLALRERSTGRWHAWVHRDRWNGH